MVFHNILGNRDGEVLDDPGTFKTKEESKLGALEHILQPDLYPELYGTCSTKFASTTTRPVETTKKDGTTSISSDARLSHADQSRFPLSRLDPRRAYRSRPDPVLDLAQRTPEFLAWESRNG